MFNHLLPNQFMSYGKLRYKLGDYLSYGNVSGTVEEIKEYKGGALITILESVKPNTLVKG